VSEDDSKYLVPGLVRGIEILRLFSRERQAMSPPEMARELGIPRSTVFRLVQTLEHLGLLRRSAAGGEFSLDIGVLSLGFQYLTSLDLSEVARPVMERLSTATGRYSHLVVRDGNDVVVMLRESGASAFESSLHVGARLPAHGTVLGRMVLAYLDADELDAIYPDGVLPAFSEQTPGRLSDLKILLEEDRQRGYAISNGFFERGISAVAAPVLDSSDQVIAAINVTVPGALPEGDLLEAIVSAVVHAATELSGLLDHHVAAPSVASA
jgi:DNA-binding IclR family transcriptional regulator